MAKTWGRLYHGMRNHRKIQVLRQQCRGYWQAVYVLLELAMECDDEGRIYISPERPFSWKELGKELGISSKNAQNLVELCLKLDLFMTFSPGIFGWKDYKKRQYQSDISTPRVQKYREKQKQGNTDETFRNDEVKHTRTEQNRNRTDTEKENPPIVPPQGGESETPKPVSVSKSNGREQEFDSFWKAYPRKTAKPSALARWRFLVKNGRLPPLTKILSAIETQKTWPQWDRENGKYIPHPATWLNQERWEDEPPPEAVDPWEVFMNQTEGKS